MVKLQSVMLLGTIASFVLGALTSPLRGDPGLPPPPSIGPAAVVQARQPREEPRARTSPAEAGLDDQLVVDLRTPDFWFADLVARGLLPNPRDIRDPVLTAERERRQLQAESLPEPEKAQRLGELREWWRVQQEIRWKNAVENWLAKMCLFLDGRPFPDITPEWIYSWPEYDADGKYAMYHALQFRLRKTPANRTQWMDLLRGWGVIDRPTVVSVGFAKPQGERPDIMPSEVAPHASIPWQRFRLATAPPKALIGSALLISLLGILALWLAISSNLLRDTSAPLRPGDRYPFSLGLCQMAFWLFLIAGGFLFLWVVMGEYDTITTSELVLLGLSATTGLGAALIDQSLPSCQPPILTKEERELRDPALLRERRVAAREEAQRLRQELVTVRAARAIESAPDAKADAEIKRLESAYDLADARAKELWDRESYFGPFGWLKQFFLDLLRERDSVSLHRFQMLTWTIILGVVFTCSVLLQLAMPKFDPVLLILMGISNSTYLTFKYPAAQRRTASGKDLREV